MRTIGQLFQTIHHILSDQALNLIISTTLTIILARKPAQKMQRILKKSHNYQVKVVLC
jgi:hypothetical protein